MGEGQDAFGFHPHAALSSPVAVAHCPQEVAGSQCILYHEGKGAVFCGRLMSPWFIFCSELTFYSLQIGPTLKMVTAIEQENLDERQNLSLQF